MRLGFILLVATLVAVPAVAGPPWISIELPANPLDPSTKGAVLLVHAYHHRTEIDEPVAGTAEGLIDGQRRSIKLEFTRTSRTGVFALANQWGERGEWTLLLTVPAANHGAGEGAQAMVQVSGSKVLSVEVPTRQAGQWTFPRSVTPAELEASLRGRLAKSTTDR